MRSPDPEPTTDRHLPAAPPAADPDRRNANRLARVLRWGTVAAVTVIILGVGATLLELSAAGRWLQRAGMMIMVATPAAGLACLGIGFAGVGNRRYLVLIAAVLLLIAITALL